MLQRVDLGDRVSIEPAATLTVTGFAGDTLVRDALTIACCSGGRRAAVARDDREADSGRSGPRRRQLRCRDGASARERDARQPTAARRAACARRDGSVRTSRSSWSTARNSDAATGPSSSRSICRRTTGSCVALPLGATKESTAAVYRRFDDRAGADGWKTRNATLQSALAAVRRPRDLAALPPNDLASSPLAAELLRLGAFRADVSGAGPAVYGLFHHRRHAGAARRALRSAARTWLTVPVWYG